MKKAIILCLLVSGFALPAHAGHGTIRETETQVFVEYYGDGNDKLAIQTTSVASAQPRQMQPHETQPAEAAAQPVARQAGKERDARGTQQDEARKQRNEAWAARQEEEKAARRKDAGVRATRSPRQTSTSVNEE